jgi:hypothetical protein
VSNRNSYALNGADRFQLYFDDLARENSGIGNVIRVAITLDGVVSEWEIRKFLEANEWLRFFSTLLLRKNFFSGLYNFEAGSDSSFSIAVHQGPYEEAMQHVLSKDCNLISGAPVHADVIYNESKTLLVISASHVLMDHAGMENLIASFAGENNLTAFNVPTHKKLFFSKLRDAFSATMFVSALSGWTLRRLARKSRYGNAAFELIEFTEEESYRIRNHMTKGMNASALSFYLGCSMYSISKFQNLLTGKNYFVPVPMDRRPASCKTSLLSNFISFIYFKATEHDLDTLKNSVDLISKQTITQARKNMPAKFSSLLDLFRFVPKPIYKSFIDLPSNGHAATFAFSLLSNSRLEGKKIMGCDVTDVTHYSPVISPPGLNVIFSEFNSRLKILCSFDESRITRNEVASYLETLKLNLLG